MKRMVLFILLLIFTVVFIACKTEELNDIDNQGKTNDNNGTITFVDVERAELEEYVDNENSVFLFWLDEKSDKSRKDIYEMLLKGKTNEDLYLASGIVIMTAKDLLELKAVDGLDIELREYRYEDYVISAEYIEECEARFDKLKIFINKEMLKNEYQKREKIDEYVTIDGLEACYQDEIVESYQLDVDYISRDGMYNDGYYIVANIDKSTMLSLYKDERIQGMTKCIYVEEIMGNTEYKRPIVFNGYIEQSQINWPEK